MPNLARVRVEWAGTPVVGGGLSTFYFDEAHSGFQADLQTFFDAIKGVFPSLLTWRIPGSGDLIDVATGGLSGTWTEGSDLTVSATGVGQYPLGVGARLTWRTAGLTNGRRVTGATYLAPLLSGQFEGSSALVAAVVTLFNTAGNSLQSASAGNMMIYTQPRPGTAGAASAVTAASCPDKVSWLRSRRT